MPYNIKEPRKSVKSEWRKRAAEFETDETAEVIRSYGGSEKKEIVGRWINEDDYISIDGIKSQGECPINYGRNMNQFQFLRQTPVY